MHKAAGKPILAGIAIGRLRVRRGADSRTSAPSGLSPERELERFEAARSLAKEQLERLRQEMCEQVGTSDADIFQVHQLMLDDEDYLAAVRYIIETQSATAEYAVWATGENFASAFSAIEDSDMQSREADVRDVSNRVADILTGRKAERPFPDDSFILAVDDLTPSQAVQLDRGKLLGFVTRRGSANSHTAILARALNIPALTAVDFDENWDGHLAILDGCNSCVYVDPEPELLSDMEEKLQENLRERSRLQSMKHKSDVTLDGTSIALQANIASDRDVGLALQNGAHGIGLLRSEFIFLEAEQCPTEEQQFRIYRRVVETMAGKSVTIRTLDIGADKEAAYFHLPPEPNPALGRRAIRFCLQRRDVFRQQLRAILRASAFGPVSVMFPMIVSLEEVRAARAILDSCRVELIREGCAVGSVEVGIMVETPAAVVMAGELAREVDFFSIGTNDLVQYTLAVDRQNGDLADLYNPGHPAILRMIRYVVDAAHRNGCKVGICGSMGGDPALTETFLRMGLDKLSVPPAAILPLRSLIRSLDLST